MQIHSKIMDKLELKINTKNELSVYIMIIQITKVKYKSIFFLVKSI